MTTATRHHVYMGIATAVWTDSPVPAMPDIGVHTVIKVTWNII